jgi:hypothetical protein
VVVLGALFGDLWLVPNRDLRCASVQLSGVLTASRKALNVSPSCSWFSSVNFRLHFVNHMALRRSSLVHSEQTTNRVVF